MIEITERTETKMDEQDQLYAKNMESWFKEQAAVERQIKCTIETSEEVLKQNKIQLEILQRRNEIARKDYNEWLAEKVGSETVEPSNVD